MKKLLIIMALFTMCGFARADEWTAEDTEYQLVYSSLHLVDWVQTYDAVGGNFNEDNRMLGKNPSKGDVNSWMASTLLLHYVIARALPSEYRRWWQLIWISTETLCIEKNYRVGVRIDF